MRRSGAPEQGASRTSPRGSPSPFRRRRFPALALRAAFTFVLEDRAGKDIEFLAENLKTFLEAARKRPETRRTQSPRSCPPCRRSSSTWIATRC